MKRNNVMHIKKKKKKENGALSAVTARDLVSRYGLAMGRD